MKIQLLSLCGLLWFCSCQSKSANNQTTQKPPMTVEEFEAYKTNILDSLKKIKVDAIIANILERPVADEKYADFKLKYKFSTISGSFEVVGSNYVYTRYRVDQRPTRNTPITIISSGNLRNGSMDSIINIMNSIKDTLVYRTNANIFDGHAVYISISYKGKIVKFELHNTTNSNVKQILKILNSNMYIEKWDKLGSMDYPD